MGLRDAAPTAAVIRNRRSIARAEKATFPAVGTPIWQSGRVTDTPVSPRVAQRARPSVLHAEAENLAARVVRDLSGFMITQALGVVADLGVADTIGDSPVAIDDVALAVGAKTDPLYRAMRALASLGYFTETAPRSFAHTPLSQLLRDGTPGSLRHYARWVAGELT